MRIVLDTNILVRTNSLVAPVGLARDLLLTIVSGPHTLLLSPAILTEVRRVLEYPHVQKRWPLSASQIEAYLSALEGAGVMIDLPLSIPAIVSDPDDDPILQTAILGSANILCSRDEAFQHAAVQTVCAAHGIRIVADVDLIQQLRFQR